jgi:hypothetical protein
MGPLNAVRQFDDRNNGQDRLDVSMFRDDIADNIARRVSGALGCN